LCPFCYTQNPKYSTSNHSFQTEWSLPPAIYSIPAVCKEPSVGPAVQCNGLYLDTQLSGGHSTCDQYQYPVVLTDGAPQPAHTSAWMPADDTWNTTIFVAIIWAYANNKWSPKLVPQLERRIKFRTKNSDRNSPVVITVGRKLWKEGTDHGSNSRWWSAQGIPSTSQEQQSQSHVCGQVWDISYHNVGWSNTRS